MFLIFSENLPQGPLLSVTYDDSSSIRVSRYDAKLPFSIRINSNVPLKTVNKQNNI